MPGNKAVYSDAIKKAANAAWDGKWKVAIAEYRRAIDEMPQDASAHFSLAHVLDQSKQFEEAIEECRIASKLSPQDPEPLARIADLQEKLGQLSPAASTYLSAAEMYSKARQIDKAVEMLQRAAALEPERVDTHLRLAQAYEQEGEQILAAREYVALAKICQKRGDKFKMSSHALRALTLDPNNVAARTMADQLQRQDAKPEDTGANPVDQAEQAALSSLAATLLEDKAPSEKPSSLAGEKPSVSTLSPSSIDALIARAVDAQTQHQLPEAIDCYEQLVAGGVNRSEIKFNLGLLYSESKRYDESIALLSQIADETNYALASHYTLGQCYRAKGDRDRSAEHFLEVTKIVDLTSVQRDQADELISVYEGLAESFTAKGEREQAESFSRALEEFLTSKGWEDKVKQVRKNLESLRDEGGQISLAEVIELPNSTQVLEALSLSQDYMEKGKFIAAIDECLRAIELAPLYIAAHVRLAHISARAGRIDEARAKYQTLADLSSVRGELARAEWFSHQLLEVAPDDVTCRTKLIDILTRQKRAEAALEQYVELGNSYNQQGQYNLAADKFAEGIQLAATSEISSPIVLNLHHHLAQARSSQGDFKSALAAFKEIHHNYPDDERANIALVDLEFRMGQVNPALKDLEDLLTRFRACGNAKQATTILQDLVKNYPDSTPLRAQLALNYLSLGDNANAITTLDTLGEMQLSAGQKQAAAATIRQIISLNPPRIAEYKQLLQSISE